MVGQNDFNIMDEERGRYAVVVLKRMHAKNRRGAKKVDMHTRKVKQSPCC